MIKITVNGKSIEIKKSLSVEAYIQSLQLDPLITIVEQNGIILEKTKYGNININDGDILELIRFMGGGA